MTFPFRYYLRNLFVRRGTTLMTVGSVAFVVLVYIGVLSLAAGLEQAFGASGDPRNVIVLREGSTSETTSYYPVESYRELAVLPGVEMDAPVRAYLLECGYAPYMLVPYIHTCGLFEAEAAACGRAVQSPSVQQEIGKEAAEGLLHRLAHDLAGHDLGSLLLALVDELDLARDGRYRGDEVADARVDHLLAVADGAALHVGEHVLEQRDAQARGHAR